MSEEERGKRGWAERGSLGGVVMKAAHLFSTVGLALCKVVNYVSFMPAGEPRVEPARGLSQARLTRGEKALSP